MNLIQRIGLNIGWQVVSHGVGLATSIAGTVLLTRHLGSHGFGEYATIVAFGALLASFSDLGLSLFLTRELSRHGRRAFHLLDYALGLRLVASLSIVLATAAGAMFLPYTPTVRLGIVLISLSPVFISLSSILVAASEAHLRFDRVAIGDMVNRLLAFTVTLWVIATRQSLTHLIGGIVLAHATQFGLLVVLTRPHIPVRFRLDALGWRQLWQGAAPFALMAILAVMYARADMLILSLFFNPSGAPDVGIYGAAYRVLDALLIFPVAIVRSIFPILAQTLPGDASSPRISAEAFRILAILAFPVVLGGIALAVPIMHAVTGPEFAQPVPVMLPLFGSVMTHSSALALQLLLVVLFFMFFGLLNGHVLVAAERQRTLLGIFARVVPLNIVLSLMLIPRYSFVGAGMATLVSEVAGFLWTSRAVAQIGVRYSWTWMARPAAAASLMAAGLAVSPTLYVMPLAVRVALAAVIYIGGLYIVRGVPPVLVNAFMARKVS